MVFFNYKVSICAFSVLAVTALACGKKAIEIQERAADTIESEAEDTQLEQMRVQQLNQALMKQGTNTALKPAPLPADVPKLITVPIVPTPIPTPFVIATYVKPAPFVPEAVYNAFDRYCADCHNAFLVLDKIKERDQAIRIRDKISNGSMPLGSPKAGLGAFSTSLDRGIILNFVNNVIATTPAPTPTP